LYFAWRHDLIRLAVVAVVHGRVEPRRTALPVFPRPPLKFRTAGFPQYGFKQTFKPATFVMTVGLSAVHIHPPASLIRWLSVRTRLTRQILRLFAVRVLFALLAVFRTLRFNRPRRLPTSTRSSRGPWLARRLCCPSGSSLTMASSEPLDPQQSDLCFSHYRRPRIRPRAAIQRFPNLLRKTVRPCRLPYPGGFVSAFGCCFLTNSGLRR
jgi:hypothetical protein